MADVFISYKKEDRAKTEMIATALVAHHMSVWWDESLAGGETYRSQIERELAQAGAAIVIWSKLSVKSGFVLDEASEAHNHSKLLPVTFERDVVPPMGFRQIQILDLSDWSGDPQDPRFLAVLRGVQTLCGARFGQAVRSIGGAVATSVETRKPALDALGASGKATFSSLRFFELLGLPLYRLVFGAGAVALLLAALEFVGRTLSRSPADGVLSTALFAFVAMVAIRAAHQFATILFGKSSRQFFDSGFTFWTILAAIVAPVIFVTITPWRAVTPQNGMIDFAPIVLFVLGLFALTRLAIAGVRRLAGKLK
jgi:uncharacterized protein YggT (Ycf19 family)